MNYEFHGIIFIIIFFGGEGSYDLDRLEFRDMH